MLILIFQILTSFVTWTSSQGYVTLDKVDCGPHDHYVVVDELFRYTPQVVKIPRCFGKNDNRKFMKCTPKRIENITIFAHEPPLWKTLTVEKHAQCHEVCTLTKNSCNANENFDSQNCFCNCKHNADPGICSSPFYWDQSHCDCRCSRNENTYKCTGKKVFSSSECGCTCDSKYVQECNNQAQYIDLNTCLCTGGKPGVVAKSTGFIEEGIPQTTVILIAVFEVVLFVAVIYVFDKYLCKKKPHLKRFSSTDFSTKFPKKLSNHHVSAYQSIDVSTSNLIVDEGFCEDDSRSYVASTQTIATRI